MKIMYSSVFSVKAWLGQAAGSMGGIAIALLEVARFMVMRLIASIIIQGVPISFSSLLPATFYFITIIVKSELVNSHFVNQARLQLHTDFKQTESGWV